MLKKTISVFAALLLTLCPLWAQSAAATDGIDEGAVNFSVKAVRPSNQIDPKNTYFDLKMEPSARQTLVVEIYNNAQSDLQVRVALNTASTNENGLIDYSTNNTADTSLKTPFTSIAKVKDNIITVPAGGVNQAEIELQMPSEPYDGVILGGIEITGVSNELTHTSAQGISIKNEYAYVIGVKLTESDVEVAPELNLVSVEPTLVNYRTALVANIQNSQSAIIKGMSVAATVNQPGGGTEPLRQARKNPVDMAPNSTYSFPIDWGNQKIAPGIYQLHMTATLGDKSWEWDESFTIAEGDANVVNQNALYLRKGLPLWLYITIGALALAALFAFAGFWLGRNRSKG